MRMGAKLVSEGSPANLNRLTRFHTVQERANTPWNTTGPTFSVLDAAIAGNVEARLRFTDVSLMNDQDYKHQLISNLPSAVAGVLARGVWAILQLRRDRAGLQLHQQPDVAQQAFVHSVQPVLPDLRQPLQ